MMIFFNFSRHGIELSINFALEHITQFYLFQSPYYQTNIKHTYFSYS